MKAVFIGKKALGLYASFALLLWPGVCPAALTVTNANDNGPGSLRQAIQDAAPGDTINFSISGTIILTNGELVIGTNLTIIGPGATNLSILRDSGSSYFRLLKVNGGTVTIAGLCISNGIAAGTNGINYGDPGGDGFGGGILNSATLSLVDCNLAGNAAIGGSGAYGGSGNGGFGAGGAVRNVGSLLLTNCVISGNSALGGGTDTSASGLGSGGAAEGGGISNAGDLTMLNCVVRLNAATGRDSGRGAAGGRGAGGAVANAGTLRLSNCTVNSNSVFSGLGGTGSGYFPPQFPGGPGGDSSGGAIYSTGTLVANNCTLSSNSVRGNTGGGAGAYTGGGRGGAAAGAGIWQGTPGSVSFTNCTLSGNFARGGDGGGGFAVNCGGTGGDGAGGGIFVSSGIVVMVNCTTASNSVSGGNGGQGGMRPPTDPFCPNCPCTPPAGGSFGGGIFNQSGSISLRNTIIAGNSSSDFSGIAASSGRNLVGLTNGSSGWLTTDLKGNFGAPLDARLAPLQDNGGSTFAMALLRGSPAIDQGASAGLASDQRGRPRRVDNPAIPNAPGGDGSDIGAFELQSQPIKLAVPVKSGANLIISFLSEAGLTNRVERTDNLNSPSWTTMAAGIVGTGGSVEVADPGAASQPQRFYRGLTLP